MSLNQLEKNVSKEDIINDIEGYTVPLITPFGKVQSLCANLYGSGRSLKAIEFNVEKFIRPFSEQNSVKQQVINSCKQNILKQLTLSEKSHECMAFQPGYEMDCYKSICSFYLNQVKEQDENIKVNVYLQNNQSYKSVLPWLENSERFRIITLDTDKLGNLIKNGILSTVTNHIQESKYHIISLQSTSLKSKQIFDLNSITNEIEGLRSEFPDKVFSSVIDATQIIFQKEQENALIYFDFIVIQSSCLLGGQLAANLLLARKENANIFSNIDFLKYGQEIEPSAIFRTSQVMDFIKLNNIQGLMEQSENSKIFFEEIKKINEQLQAGSILTKIHLGVQEPNKNGRYSIILFQEGGEAFIDDEGKEGHGRPILQSKFLSQFLNDLFGIQSKCNKELKTSNDFYFSDIPSNFIKQYGLTSEEGFIELNSSTVDIDIHFLLTKEEVLYIAQALKLIAQYSLKLLKYYNNQNLLVKQFTPVEFDFSFAVCCQFQGDIDEIKPNKELYNEQMTSATKLLKNPESFFSLQEGWSEDKTTIFPQNTFPDVLPKKGKTTSSKQNLKSNNDLQSSELKDQNEQRNLMINEEGVKKAREMILKIQKDKVDNQQNGDQEKAQEQVKELQLKIQQLELNTKIPDIDVEKLKIEIKEELEKEYKRRYQLDKDYQFDVSLKVKERRTRNLRTIYSFYSNLIDVLEEKKESERPQHIKKPKKWEKQEEKPVEKPKTLAINKFFKFCDDFSLINQELDIKTLYQMFNKINTQTNGEILFNEFQLLLEKMGQVYYSKNDQLYTQFDKTEQFYRHIGLDDAKLFKSKLKEEGLVNFSFVFHDKYKLYNSGHVIPNNPEFNSYQSRYSDTITTPSIYIQSNLNLKKKDDLDWQSETLTVNPKQMYHDRYLSQDDIFSEVAYLSILNNGNSSANRNSSLQPQTRALVRNMNYASPNNPKVKSIQGSIHDANLKLSPQQSSPPPPQSNKQEFYKYMEYKNNSMDYQNNLQSSPKYDNVGKIKSEYQEINLYSDNNYIAEQRKQQLLLRAKQIANQEKEKDTQRMRKITNESSPNNVQSQYSPKLQGSNIYPQQQYKAQKMDYINNSSFVNSPNTSSEQQNINLYKNQSQKRIDKQ